MTLDNKLQIKTHADQLAVQINKKIYSIKRLFYLPFSVKLHFFKSFILPYFNYCCSLFIYYNNVAINLICKMYYLCLHKLFNFNLYGFSTPEIDMFLKQYNLSSSVSRVIWSLTMLVHKLNYSNNSPKILKSWISPVQNDNLNYNLRSNKSRNFQSFFSRSRFGDLNFKNIMSKFLNSINFLSFSTRFQTFSSQLSSNIIFFVSNLASVLPKLNINLEYYVFLN